MHRYWTYFISREKLRILTIIWFSPTVIWIFLNKIEIEVNVTLQIMLINFSIWSKILQYLISLIIEWSFLGSFCFILLFEGIYNIMRKKKCDESLTKANSTEVVVRMFRNASTVPVSEETMCPVTADPAWLKRSRNLAVSSLQKNSFLSAAIGQLESRAVGWLSQASWDYPQHIFTRTLKYHFFRVDPRCWTHQIICWWR